MARHILADERRDHRWRPTELVQESYLRLLDWRTVRWQNRAHFFATAARMMRRVLVDAARTRRAVKRNAEWMRFRSTRRRFNPPASSVDVVALEGRSRR